MSKFADFLKGNELDCELIIGGVDMPATFVWDGACLVTDYCMEKFRPIMESEYQVLPNGNVEVFCEDWRLGEYFCYAVAGYISVSEYNKLFGEC